MLMEHWAYGYAEEIIQQRGDKDCYICASGITPSGTVHIGNFREVMSVELVVRALQDMGKKVRFLYFWDDYDVFRKRPKHIEEGFDSYIGRPISQIPDPQGKEKSFADANKRRFSDCLPQVGVEAEFISQAQCYQDCRYAAEIKLCLSRRDEIRAILNTYRKEALPESWWPISVYSECGGTDKTEIIDWDGEDKVLYRCLSCGKEYTLDLQKQGYAKLLWRMDWPMRWKHYGVDFEPAGKDHHSHGGSFNTAEELSEKIFNYPVPISFQYDFISIKGHGGKMSSSSGDTLALDEVLKVYQPELIRYLFAATRPNREFAISFDLDVIKLYEDYDRCERGTRVNFREAGIYRLSQVKKPDINKSLIPSGDQIPFRHLCNLVQIMEGDIDKTLSFYYGEQVDLEQARRRAICAYNWVSNWAPEDFCFKLRDPDSDFPEMSTEQRLVVTFIALAIESEQVQFEEEELVGLIKEATAYSELSAREVFVAMYRALIQKDNGPRLAGFMVLIGKERVLERLKSKRLRDKEGK